MFRPRPPQGITEMSLRAFHILFIVLSVILTAFFAAWAYGQYRVEQDTGYVIAAVASPAPRIRIDIIGAKDQLQAWFRHINPPELFGDQRT